MVNFQYLAVTGLLNVKTCFVAMLPVAAEGVVETVVQPPTELGLDWMAKLMGSCTPSPRAAKTNWATVMVLLPRSKVTQLVPAFCAFHPAPPTAMGLDVGSRFVT